MKLIRPPSVLSVREILACYTQIFTRSEKFSREKYNTKHGCIDLFRYFGYPGTSSERLVKPCT